MKPHRPAWRSYCPVARTLDLVGDRWTLVVVRDLLLGMTRYDEFLDRPERIATNVLADRLKALEAMGFVARFRYGEHARRYEYRLTQKGEELRPLVQAIVDWGLRYIPGSETRLWPKRGYRGDKAPASSPASSGTRAKGDL